MPTKKTTVKPTKKKKSSSTSKSSRSSKATDHSKSSENKAVETALNIIDQTASLLRKGVVSGVETTSNVQHKARRDALKLITKATEHLHKAIDLGEKTAEGFLSPKNKKSKK